MNTNFNVTERYIANLLSQFPGLKSSAKRLYQKINYLIYKKNYSYQTKYQIQTIDSGERETFFGYYDKSPICNNGKYIIYHESEISTKKLPSATVPVFLKVYDLVKQKEIFSHESYAYNWQQGSKAQWVNDEEFIFNNFDKGEYVSIIANVKTGNLKKIPSPIYDCFKNQFALTLNFERLMSLRPDYGYRNKPPLSNDDLFELKNDGVFFIDFVSLKKEMILSLQQIIEVGHKIQMDKATHKVNHIMVSPNGEKFMFLHRYFINKKRFDRLLIADVDGNNLKLLCDDEMVSHCCWVDNKTIISYLRDKEFGDRFYRINIEDASKEILGEGIIDKYGDGHPTFNNYKVLFDTYPDKSRMKHLFIYDISSSKLEEIGGFYESLSYYGETRSDLHPRFSPDGEKIFFDSVHEGKRRLYWINLNSQSK
ncbi:TolB family protein [Belliella pelovolcani]|uniref:WD40-like Beta Propeller Repeat n=1 Tax=Belliella pelovolcani TaxID=529505 RepID=A0A1N7MEG6_9BACT|nr:hypothetical protein [Belliella pelovolcani]SIS84399.1 hypothetical protein SAMN05421761_10611 [Belliella pelovolcani]